MVKNLVKSKIVKKVCFGTKEWSENSGICGRCQHKDECGEKSGKK